MRYLVGFNLDSMLETGGLLSLKVAAGVSISKGQALIDNGSGYVTNSVSAFAATFVGIAACDADNSGGSDGDINVQVIPPLPHYRFWVPNESATVATQDDVGEICDLESNDGIDVTDNSATGWGFMIDEIDISADALAVEDGGYCKGHFIRTSAL